MCLIAAARTRYSGELLCEKSKCEMRFCNASLDAFSRLGREIGLSAHAALRGTHRHTSQSQPSGWLSARTVRRAHVSDIPCPTRRPIRSVCSGVQASSEKSPYLLAVSPVIPEAALPAGFGLESSLESASSLIPAESPLPVRAVRCLESLESFVGPFLKVMTEAFSVSSRVASMPAATSSDKTSLMRLHSHRADFGHALSLVTSTPCASAMAFNCACIFEEVSEHSSCSSMSLMMACATGDPSSVAWFCTRTTSSQSLRNVSAPQPMTS